MYTSRHHDPHPEATSVWENDARYFYYAHGPLARVELGDLKVQGMDYVYTLQGWIKGVNSSTLDSLRDPGLDGWVDNSNVNKFIPKDVMGYNLNYFTGDYAAVNTAKSGASAPFASIVGSDVESNRYDLYNGNIGSMVTTITNPTTREVLPLGNAYLYDQLNRIKQARSFTNLDFATNQWQSGSTYSGMYENTFNYDANGNILGQLRKDHTGSVIDSLTYRYARNTNNRIIRNRLYHVNDNTDYNSNDIDDMGLFDSDLADINSNNNYGYTAIGELAKDEQEGIDTIIWNVSGKVIFIGKGNEWITFSYDAMGQRSMKIHYKTVSPFGMVLNKITFYIRDASGNVMSVNEYKIDWSTYLVTYGQIEKHIYGSSRIGMMRDTVDLIAPVVDTSYYTRTLGHKQYEMSNHLGNVLSVVSDKLIPVDDDTDGTTDRYLSEILSAMDYSPFGVVLQERDFSSSAYRHGFNGQERDDEVAGPGNSYTAEFWQYDSRLGRRWNLDPINRHNESRYSCFLNSPLIFIDNKGDDVEISGEYAFISFVTTTLINGTKNSQIFRDACDQILNNPNVEVKIIEGSSCSEKSHIDQTSGKLIVTITLNKEEMLRQNLAKKDGKGDAEIESTPESRLFHEIAHVLIDIDQNFDPANTVEGGPRPSGKMSYDSQTGTDIPDAAYDGDEATAVELENLYRKEQGMAVRTHYDGVLVKGKVYSKQREDWVTTNKIHGEHNSSKKSQKEFLSDKKLTLSRANSSGVNLYYVIIQDLKTSNDTPIKISK